MATAGATEKEEEEEEALRLVLAGISSASAVVFIAGTFRVCGCVSVGV